MLNFCTLFDSNYLSRGVALYHSLKETCEDFKLYIFAFDDRSHKILRELNLHNTIIISLNEFEDDELLKIKPSRTAAEYCWTCTPSIILFCIEKYNLEICTYIDADMQFYSNPKVLIEEMGNKSVLITEHRYSPDYLQFAISGKYCVQFVTFMNGMKVLNWWRNACLEWCYARYEDNKFGDQKYLDDWVTKFDGVHELQHLGGGMAPWNIQQYVPFLKNGKLYGKEKKTGKLFEVIFYHFHYLRFFKNDIVLFSHYRLSYAVRKLIYKPYLVRLETMKKQIQSIDNSFDPHGAKEFTSKLPWSIKDYIKIWVVDLLMNIKSFIKILTLIELKNKINNYNYYNVKKTSK